MTSADGVHKAIVTERQQDKCRDGRVSSPHHYQGNVRLGFGEDGDTAGSDRNEQA